MSKLYKLMAFLAIGLAGCGGGGSTTSTSYIMYDMWDYVVSDQNITKHFDLYDTDSNFNPTGGVYLNAGDLKETLLSSTSVKQEEIVNDYVTDTEVLTVSDNYIKVENGNTLHRYRSIGSDFGGCTIAQHYDTYIPMDGYNFVDVIEIHCDDYSMFYAKGKGKILGQGIYTINGDTSYSISIANNISN